MAVYDIATLIFLSGSRWRKLRLLFVEKWKVLIYRVSCFVSVNPAAKANSTGGQALTHHWQYISRVSVPKDLYENSTDLYKQDVWHDDDTIVTELDYKIIELPQASMVTNEVNHRSIYDQYDTWQSELSFKLLGYKPALKRSMPIQRRLSGLTASLYGNVAMAGGNYGHWLIDGLSRLFLIERVYNIHDIDHFLVPPLRYDFHRESLIALGIPDHKIVEIKALECIQFERLISTSSPRGISSSTPAGWMIEGYRDRLLKGYPSQCGKRRIYVSRKDAGTRKFDNEDAIIALLERYGFESVELSKYGFAEKIRLFAEANVVVGLSGAGLTNVMFCPKGATLIEFQPSTLAAYMFTAIATYLDMTVHSIYFNSDSLLSRINRNYGNFYLDLHKVEEKLRLLE